MPGTCCVCQETMDLEEYNDPRPNTAECFKLECGHAYHTQCIFRYIRETDYECLHCNVRRTPREELEMTGLIAQTIEELRGDQYLQHLRRDVEEAIADLAEVRVEVKRALEALAPDVVARAGYPTIRKEALHRMRALKAHVKAECIRRNPRTAGVWGIAGDTLLMRAFLPRSSGGLYSSAVVIKI